MNLIEKTADPADMASQLEDQYHEQRRLELSAEERQRLAAYAQLCKKLGVERITACQEEDCGEDLVEQRIADRRIRCTTCEDVHERRKKQRRAG